METVWRGGGRQRPALEVSHCARRAPPQHLGDSPEQGRGLRCTRIYQEARTGLSERRERTPRAGSPISGACTVLGLTGVLGGILACILGWYGPSPHGELPSRVSIRRSGLNPFLAPQEWPCAAEGERCSGRIGTPQSRRGSRRLDRLVSRTQCTNEPTARRARRCGYVKNKAYMAGQTPFFGDFPAIGRTLARKRWPWPKRPPVRFFFV